MKRERTENVTSGASKRDTRAVMYLRVASASNGTAERVATQRAACQRIAEQRGLTVIREYTDLGKPARLVEQVALQELLNDLEAQRDAAFVVIADLARLARKPTSALVIIQLLRNAGAKVVTSEEIRPAELGGSEIR